MGQVTNRSVEKGQSLSKARRRKPLSSVGAVAQSVVAKFAILGINAATGVITARALLPAGRGDLAAMILWPVFLANTLTLGIPSALTFQLKSTPKKASELLGAGFLLAAFTSLIAIAVGFIFMHAWIPQYSARTIFFAQIFLLAAPLTSLLNTGRAAFQTRDEFWAVNTLLVCPPALTLASLIVLLLAHSLNPYTAAMAYAPAGIVPVVWMMWRLWRLFRPSLTGFWISARQLFSYGIRSYGIDLCGTMALYVDQAVVVRFLMPDMMGVYVVALSLSRMLSAFHTSVVLVLFPKAVSQPSVTIREMTSRAMRMSSLLTVSAGALIAVLGPEVLTLLYGAEYRGATAVLRILVLEVVLSGATQVLSQAFMAIGRPGVITALQLTGLALSVPLMIVLVPRFGIVGAGTALLISTSARFAFLLVSFPVFLNMPVPRLLPRRNDLNCMIGIVREYFQQFAEKALRTAEELE
jgi:O-antigen/teichoic acid export membrane protein